MRPTLSVRLTNNSGVHLDFQLNFKQAEREREREYYYVEAMKD